jgi:TPR repeat protein
MYSNGEGVARDLNRAAGLFKRACDAGGSGGCLNLGLMYEHGRGMPKDRSRAADLFKQACDGGFDPGCKNLARMKK